jgi:hypothetical protein
VKKCTFSLPKEKVKPLLPSHPVKKINNTLHEELICLALKGVGLAGVGETLDHLIQCL